MISDSLLVSTLHVTCDDRTFMYEMISSTLSLLPSLMRCEMKSFRSYLLCLTIQSHAGILLHRY